jgi:hypothetical protein
VRTIEGSGPLCEYVFSEDQPWAKTKRLSFIDETQDLASIYDEEFSPRESRGSVERPQIPSRYSKRQPSASTIANPRSRSSSPSNRHIPSNGQPTPSKRRRLNHAQYQGAGYQLINGISSLESAGEDRTPSRQHSISQLPHAQRYAESTPYNTSTLRGPVSTSNEDLDGRIESPVFLQEVRKIPEI